MEPATPVWVVASKQTLLDDSSPSTAAGTSCPPSPISLASWHSAQTERRPWSFPSIVTRPDVGAIVLDSSDDEAAPLGPLPASVAAREHVEVAAVKRERVEGDVPPGQPNPPSPAGTVLAEPLDFIPAKMKDVPGFSEAGKLLDSFDNVLNEAVVAFKQNGFDLFEDVLQAGIKQLGFVRETNAGKPAEVDTTGGKADVEPAEVPDAETEMFWEASSKGKFDMKSRVGQIWSKEVLQDKKMRDAYGTVGKGYEAQRRFRADWAAKKFIALKTRREKKEISTQASRARGIHMPIKCIWVKEGKDAAAARATSNYILTCLHYHSKGETCNGVPYIEYNDFTRRYEFLYIKKNYDNTHEKKWEVTEQEEAPDEEPAAKKKVEAEVAAIAPPEKKRKVVTKDAAAVPPKTPEKKKRGADKNNPVSVEAKQAAAARRKLMSAKFAKVKSMKVRADAAQTRWSDILAQSTTASWKEWAQDDLCLKGMHCKAALDEFKASSTVWTAWAHEAGGFDAYCKKTFDDELVENQLSRSCDLELLIGALEQQCSRLLNMQKANCCQ